MLWYGCVAAWPLAHEAAVVAVYAALVRAGVDPNLARETVDVAPLTYVWPDATCTDDGRRCYAREDVRAGLDYSDEGAVPDALDFMLAMGAQR